MSRAALTVRVVLDPADRRLLESVARSLATLAATGVAGLPAADAPTASRRDPLDPSPKH